MQTSVMLCIHKLCYVYGIHMYVTCRTLDMKIVLKIMSSTRVYNALISACVDDVATNFCFDDLE
jgi:hypothetical protein